MTRRIQTFIRGLLCALAVGGAAFAVQAEPLVNDCDIAVGPTSEPELTEAYQEWTRRIIERLETMGVSCELTFIRSWARANKLFAEKEVEVLFPDIVEDQSQPGMTGMPVAMTEGFVVITRGESKKVNSLEGLAGKKVGIIRGRYYPAKLENLAGVTLERVESLTQNLDKLAYERIDATLEYEHDTVRLLERKELMDELQYGKPFGATHMAYRFHRTKEGARLMARFNIAISELIIDGTYEDLFDGLTQQRLF
ncbi:substrate-binding periplasmic protein [Halomonadaceae bacterium KBTZ08]